MDLEITFPEGRRVEARYDDYVIRLGDVEGPWWMGPQPAAFDLFLLSIGLCTAVNILAFIGERDIPGETIRMSLTTQMDHEVHMISNIIITIHLEKNFPEKYRKAIERAADSCGVKRHVLYPPRFETRVQAEEAPVEKAHGGGGHGGG